VLIGLKSTAISIQTFAVIAAQRSHGCHVLITSSIDPDLDAALPQVR
jgi:hypothetical protein